MYGFHGSDVVLFSLLSSLRFRESWSWFQLWTRREGSVCDGCSVRNGSRSAPHAPGALLRIPRPLPSHGQHRWQRAAQPHSCCQIQWWVLAKDMFSSPNILVSLHRFYSLTVSVTSLCRVAAFHLDACKYSCRQVFHRHTATTRSYIAECPSDLKTLHKHPPPSCFSSPRFLHHFRKP